MENNELQQEISRHKSRTRTIVLIFLVILSVLVAVGIYLNFYKEPENIDETGLRAFADSIRVHDAHRDSLYTQLQSVHTQDSIHIARIEDKVAAVPSIINNITRKYDNERNHINSLTVDQQLGFFATWISQADTTGK